MNTTQTKRPTRVKDLSSRQQTPIFSPQPAFLPTPPSSPFPPSTLSAPYPLPTRGPGHPLAHLSAPDYARLIDRLLEDWDGALTELGLCRAHGLTLDQLVAVTADPAFLSALALIRSIRERRRPAQEAAARDRIFSRLLTLLDQPQDTAARAREIRLVTKHLLAMMTQDPPPSPTGEVARRSRDGGGCEGAHTDTDHPHHNPPPPPLRSGTSPVGNGGGLRKDPPPSPTGEVAGRSPDGGGCPGGPPHQAATPQAPSGRADFQPTAETSPAAPLRHGCAATPPPPPHSATGEVPMKRPGS